MQVESKLFSCSQPYVNMLYSYTLHSAAVSGLVRAEFKTALFVISVAESESDLETEPQVKRRYGVEFILENYCNNS